MNPAGNARSLRPPEPGNFRRLSHGCYSQRIREAKAAELLGEWRERAPYLADVDEGALRELARIEALVQLLDDAIALKGVTNARGQPRTLVDLRLRASRRLSELQESLGMTPSARSRWAARLSSGGFADEFRRRLAEREDG